MSDEVLVVNKNQVWFLTNFLDLRSQIKTCCSHEMRKVSLNELIIEWQTAQGFTEALFLETWSSKVKNPPSKLMF